MFCRSLRMFVHHEYQVGAVARANATAARITRLCSIVLACGLDLGPVPSAVRQIFEAKSFGMRSNDIVA
jgi:hypothetical protein